MRNNTTPGCPGVFFLDRELLSPQALYLVCQAYFAELAAGVAEPSLLVALPACIPRERQAHPELLTGNERLEK